MSPASWSKGPAEVENEVRFIRKLHRGSFLILDGDTDVRFWEPRIAPNLCELVQADGKPNVVGAVERLDAGQFTGALGLVDDDFDRLLGRSHRSRNIIATPDHDLECLLLQSSALSRLLAELGSRDKIRRFEDHAGHSVRAALLERGLHFGRLRWLARRQGWDRPYPLRPREPFVDEVDWQIRETALFDAAVAAGLAHSGAALRDLLADLPKADPWHICQGHDLIELLKLGLRKVLGDLKASKGSADIAALLRQAHDEGELHAGHLGRSIRAWESRNPPYRILPTDVVP